jgi:hypothetical protein
VVPEPAGQVEDLDVTEFHAVTAGHHLQACHVSALSLRQFARVVLEEEYGALRVQSDAAAFFESAQFIHPAGAQQLAQERDQAGLPQMPWGAPPPITRT